MKFSTSTMTLKFKSRIALFNTLAVAVTTLVVFVVMYAVVGQASYAHLDDDLLVEKEEVFSNLDWYRDSIIINKMPEWDEAEHNKIEVNPTFLQIVDTKGNLIFHSSNLVKEHLFFAGNNQSDLFYNSVIGTQNIRAGQFPIRNESGIIIGQLSIAISRQESFAMLSSLLWVLCVAFPLVLLVQFAASSLAASKSIAPVHQLIRTASTIGDSNIGTRIELPKRKDELYLLTATINDLLARIETSLAQQKQFTSDASHEIRTPLAAIRGTLEVLIRKPRTQEVYEDKIADIITQVDRLHSLLDQLLHIARLDSPETSAKKENVELATITNGVVEKLREHAEFKGIIIKLNIPSGTYVTGDKLYLELILENLLSNAIKYGKEQGTIRIEWEEATRTLNVIDDGIGIAAEDLPHIFDRFYRTDKSRSSTIKGNGLGLAIVKKLCDLQQILISVESTSGTGTTFSMKFDR
ncbi:MAG: HAMP domain-containing protein [Ignavibacteria bacterium]|nr:HAMP domain-containing protein [Ignavibacteria bacterium]